MRYNKHLADRFIKDFSLPISNINEKNFEFQLNFFENRCQSMTKWNYMMDLIDEKFSGNINEFLDSCSKDISNAIERIRVKPEYFRFINDKEFCDKNVICGCGTKFNPEVGKTYLSVDLVSANFQALYHYNKDIFDGYHDYMHWINSFSESGYICRSKHARQVIFGMCNPSRQITIEKSIIYRINELIQKKYGEKLTLITSNSDELIYEVVGNLKDVSDEPIGYIIKEETGFSTRCRVFTVSKYHLETESGHVRNGFYVKHYENGENEIKCIEKQYAMIAECLLAGITNDDIPEECFHFNADGLDAIINEKFILVRDK